MKLEFTKHEKLSLKKHPDLNEKWLHDKIAKDPSILGLGELQLLDLERTVPGGGRLDLLLWDDENNRRYEVEIQLGATDPSHIIRCIEYWDLERRRYPGYDHIAVLVAEDITTRFLNVMSLLAGSIPIIAIQLDALTVGNNLILNFTQVLDQTELRIDDVFTEGGGGQTDRSDWDQKVGTSLMKLCDATLGLINEASQSQWQLNYLQGYVGLQSNGVVNNVIHFVPKKTKKFVHIRFRNSKAAEWVERFEEESVTAQSKRKGRFGITVTAELFKKHKDLIREAVTDTLKELEG